MRRLVELSARRSGWLLTAALVLLLGGIGAATAGQLVGPGTRDLAAVAAAPADPQRAAVARGLSAGAPPGSLVFTDVPVVAAPAPATDTAVSGLAANGIPKVALNAYRVAAARIGAALPACHLDWSLLAGIGRVESDHGRTGGATLGADGTSTPPVIGPALDGVHFAYVADTDRGVWDHDTRYDHAVGPMQFIPSTWRAYAIDADGNGTADPMDVNDAALAAAHYLCNAGGDLSTDAGQRRAVLAYNHSNSYVAQVLALAHAYAAGVPVADLPLAGDTSGPVPPAGPYGTPSAPAAPGPALGETDRTTSPDAVPVTVPAGGTSPAPQQGGSGRQQGGSTPASPAPAKDGGGSSPAPATQPPASSSPAPAQSGTGLPVPVPLLPASPAPLPVPSLPVPSLPVPPLPVPSLPSVPTVLKTLPDGTAVLTDGTICRVNPLSSLLPSTYCPTAK